MAELLVLEFDNVDEATYTRVNAELGLDPHTGAGAWPEGLVSHVAGVTDDGHVYVVEVWESQQAQADFMESRLGPALGAGGISSAPRVAWSRVMGHHNPGL
jgi:hypothetical protein